MLNWNWSYTLSKSVVVLAIASTLASNGAQAQTGTQLEVRNSNPSTSLKVGESRSQSLIRTKDEAIARIYTHKLDGKNAATVYVRGIPVVTYIESDSDNKPDSKVPSDVSATANASKIKSEDKSDIKGLPKKDSQSFKMPSNIGTEFSSKASKSDRDASSELLVSPDPIERATATAAMINQLSRDGIDPNTIVPAWKNGNYVINLGDRATLKFDQHSVLPDSLKNQTEDVLGSANLLRRLLGGANPVSEVLNAPKSKVGNNLAFGNINSQIVGVMSGMASWYGPGFDGSYSASGEVFNANELTAAHPSLPFGTLVRVVNMDNNQAVVVRINDRGPYAEGRIIDISTAAANMIGLLASGVAPVRLEVLSR